MLNGGNPDHLKLDWFTMQPLGRIVWLREGDELQDRINLGELAWFWAGC